MRIAVIVLALVALAQADMYLHNPRGSNNRLDEAKRDRNNANRMFDSQNNNRGGYNVGSLYYYAGSVLPVEWTNQHSCADQNNRCEIIFQYMCDEQVRDGASTNTIPTNPILCEDYDCNTDLEYGMHESFDYYLNCRLRSRNKGLFTADRNINGQNARFTRQNQNGNRRGYECPEERDHYPYWHPTPWRDIAILTNDPTRCPYYQRESANVKSRYECVLPGEYVKLFASSNSNNYIIPNNQDECEMWSWVNPQTGNSTHADWVEYIPDPRLSEPECVETLWSRDNHLGNGNGNGGFPNYFNWTIPSIPHERCVFRARYNISTGEFDGFNSSVNSSIKRVTATVFNAETNTVTLNKQISELDVYSKFGFDFESAKQRGYVYRDNPVVKIFPDVGNGTYNFGLQLAINTDQFGRTFQDRSHSFAIREKTEGMDCYDSGTIYNLNVRGKRGNIVQTYPGVEYDFVPNRLTIAEGDCIHIQWTGSNTNPNNNAGQGRAGTDRSNIVLLRDTTYTEVARNPNENKFGHFARSYPTHLDAEQNGSTHSFLGWDRESRQSLAMLSPNQYGGEMSELDDAGTYFDLGPKKVTQRGTYHYMCSRNNNFTNRSQKGKIIVQGSSQTNKRIGWNGGEVKHEKATLKFKQGDLMKPETIRVEKYASEDEAVQAIEEMTGNSIEALPGQSRSDYYYVASTENGETFASDTQQQIELNIEVDSGLGNDPKIYIANSGTQGAFKQLDTRISNGVATAYTDEGGVVVVSAEVVTQYVIISTVSFLVIVFVIAIMATGIYFRVRRDKWEKVKGKVSGGMNNIKRSFAKEV